MDFRFSRFVNPSEYHSQALADCFNGIPVREHRNKIEEDVGALQTHEDWRVLVQPLGHYKGSLAAKFNFNSTTIPECIPNRLKIIAYANEFAFIHDDSTEQANKEDGDKENDALLKNFRQGIPNSERLSKATGKELMQLQIFQDMATLDQERTINSRKAWAEFVSSGSSRHNTTAFESMEEYLPYRVHDVGGMFILGMVTFAMAISIPEEELDLCKKLLEPAWTVIGLQNDLFSWEKELRAAQDMRRSHVTNGIWVLMKEHSINVDDAKDLCRHMIKKEVAGYLHSVEENRDNPALSLDLRRCMEAMQYYISGNAVWSCYYPRYNATATFNNFQLSMMNEGVEETMKGHSESMKVGKALDRHEPPSQRAEITEPRVGFLSRILALGVGLLQRFNLTYSVPRH